MSKNKNTQEPRDSTTETAARLYALVAGQPFAPGAIDAPMARVLGYKHRESFLAALKSWANKGNFLKREGATLNLHRNHALRRTLRFLWLPEFMEQQRHALEAGAAALVSQATPEQLAALPSLEQQCLPVDVGDHIYRRLGVTGQAALALGNQKEEFLELCEEHGLLIRFSDEVWQLNELLNRELKECIERVVSEHALQEQLRLIEQRLREIGRPNAQSPDSVTVALHKEALDVQQRLRALRLQRALPQAAELARRCNLPMEDMLRGLLHLVTVQQ